MGSLYQGIKNYMQENESDQPSVNNYNEDYRSLSPYLNFDPVYLPSQPEYLFNPITERTGTEMDFNQIGFSCYVGTAIGSIRGFYKGLQLSVTSGQQGAVRRTRILNHITKQGFASLATFGTVACFYNISSVLTATISDLDDDLIPLISGTTTGLIYRSLGGLRKSLIGGSVGFGLASVYYTWNNSEKMLHKIQSVWENFNSENKSIKSKIYADSD